MFHALTNAHAAITALRPIVLALKKRSPRLADQLERAATGIALQVAEGAERVGRDQLHLYRTAAGSCREARNAIKAAVGWGYVTDDEIAAAEALLDREGRLLHGLTRDRPRANVMSEARVAQRASLELAIAESDEAAGTTPPPADRATLGRR